MPYPHPSRRTLLGGLALAALAQAQASTALARPAAGRPPAPDPLAELRGLAADERFWRAVQDSFTLDRTVINLNNGGCSPTPRSVHEAFKRYLDWSNQGPPLYMWRDLEPGLEAVRRELAAEAGCEPEHLAVTRNASEALQIVQLGLDLEPGDEVLTTEQDYPRMLQTWAQRVRRDGVVLRRVAFPAPVEHEDFVQRVLSAFTPRTRVLHLCHIVNLTGQILPVQRLCGEARARGVFSVLDGAHAFGQWPFRLDELGCDAYGTSLHKWLLAPVGTGFLFLRPEHIPRIWPLTPAPVSLDNNIRKFEEVGTHPAANHNAVAEALAFHRGLGGALKAERLRWLRRRWMRGLADLPGVRFYTADDDERSCAIGTFGLEGRGAAELGAALMQRWRIVTTPIVFAPADPTRPDPPAGAPQIDGLRVTPNVYTTPDELDRFVAAVRVLAAER